MFEAIIWFVLICLSFAVVNRLWMWLFLSAEMSRQKAGDDLAQGATVYADSRYASTT